MLDFYLFIYPFFYLFIFFFFEDGLFSHAHVLEKWDLIIRK